MAEQNIPYKDQGKPVTIPGGKLIVPPQADGQAITVVTTPAPPISDDMRGKANFSVIRLVLDIKLAKAKGTAINPAARLSVAVTPGDIVKADGKPIKIAYWAGGKWVVLTPEPGVMAEAGEMVEVNYTKYGDPPIAVGK